MARQPRTPGAADTPKATETVQTTAANADANLDAILGTAETPDSNVDENTGAAEATSTVSELVAIEPTAEELADRKEYEEFQAWKKAKATTKAEPVAPHVPAFDVGTPKRTRQVLGKDGWTTEEY